MPFAPFELLAPVKADLRGLGSGLVALTIHTPGRRLRLPALPSPLALAQRLHQLGPYPLLAPALEIGIDGIPLAELPRYHAPLTAGLEQIQDPIEHRPQLARRTPW